jgi:hypothetical protein
MPQNQGDAVETLAIQDLASACRIFMGLSYPDGPDSIPDTKRPFYNITADGSIADYLPPGVFSVGICQDLSKLKGGIPGYEFRLGSSAHPHLKMRVQLMSFHQREVWVFSVDTHDHVLQSVSSLDTEHAAANLGGKEQRAETPDRTSPRIGRSFHAVQSAET